jgi:hypothetical protein
MERLNLNIGDNTSKIQQNFKGGYVGLEKLFEFYFKSKKDKEELVFDEVNFEKFVNGQPIIILGYNVKHDLTKEIHFRKNNNKIQPYNFFNFYESNFKFEFLGQPICSNSEILQELINGLEKIKRNFDEKDFITSCKNTLMFLETEIKKSNNCKEADNPKLFAKLIYMKNGYIETYNKVYDLYSHYLINFTKVNFREKTIDEMEFSINTKQKEVNYLKNFTSPNPLSLSWKESVYREMRNKYNKTENTELNNDLNYFNNETVFNSKRKRKKPNWEYVFELILNGEIIVIKEQYKLKYFYKEKPFITPTDLGNHISTIIPIQSNLRNIVTDSINEGNTKNIFVEGKLTKIKEYISNNENKMCAFFQKKYDDLLKK